MNMEEQEYQVSWEIDISAESPEQAALLAIDYLAPMEPARWCYQVTDRGTGETISLEGEDLYETLEVKHG
jgi:hypothetical protein